MKPLQTMLNKIVRIMVFAPFQSSNPQQFFDELDLLNLAQIHNLEKAKFMYKYKAKKLPSNFTGYFEEIGENHQYNLRSIAQHNLQPSRFKTKYGKKKIQYDGTKIWNNIPTTIKESKTVNSFSGLYRAYILNSVP